jgi:hypothetical protein
MSINQKEKTIALTEKLLSSLRSAPDAVNGDKGASFVAVYKLVIDFITSLDCAVEDSAFILGDGDIAKLYAQYLERRGKDAEIGSMILGVQSRMSTVLNSRNTDTN